MNRLIEKNICNTGSRKSIAATLLVAGVSAFGTASLAASLPNGSALSIVDGVTDPSTEWVVSGSYFGMDQSGDSKVQRGEKTPIISKGTITIGSTSLATGSHNGPINGSENPAFDVWNFFSNTGLDYFRVAPTDFGDGTLNFSGWTVTWNFIAAIDMGTNAWVPGNCNTSFPPLAPSLGIPDCSFSNGVAKFLWTHPTPFVWSDASTYIVHYTATVPIGDPSGFGGVQYYLYLEGNVTLPEFSLTNDAAATTPAAPVNINVVTNDTGHPYTIDASSVVIVSNGSIGTAVANADNTITYTPSGSTGNDSFTYTVRGNSGITSSPATVNVAVNAVLPPTANGDNATVNGTTATGINVLTNDTPGTNAISASTVTVSTAAGKGTATANPDGTVTYTANAGFSGTDTFQYTVQDTAANTSNAATVNVTVQATVPASSSGSYAPGTTATAAGGTPATTGGGLTTANVDTDSALSQQCVGGCFDFQVSGLTPGSSVVVVLPLSQAIPSGAIYRKLISGTWQNFSTTGGNGAISSAAAVSAGPVCPRAGSSSYSSGLTAGNECVQLTILDGGTNDADGLANGTVLDPSGVGVVGGSVSAVTGSTSGCSLSQKPTSLAGKGDWLMVFGFLSWLGMLVHRRKRTAE